MFKYFEENQKQVEQIFEGIYKISGFEFPVQIIVTKELSQKNHLWVSSIARNLSENQLRTIITKAKTFESKAEKQYVSSILSVVSRLNTEEVEKIKGDSTMGKTLYEIMKPEIDEAREEGVLTSLLQSVKNLMKNLNISMEQAMNSLSVEPEYRNKIAAMMK